MAVEATRGESGNAMYARLWLYALEHYYGWWPFLDGKADWAMMKTGMRDLLKAHASAHNVNRFAILACVNSDWDEARRLFGLMKTGADPVLWRSRALINYCQGRVTAKG
jgi:hypothetical protein